MPINIQLKNFTPKPNPVPTDIVYLADSANSFDEVQCSVAQLIDAYPNLSSIGALSSVSDIGLDILQSDGLTSWTPVVTFATPGDLSVVYSIQSGTYIQVGNVITVTINLVFTPTFTTASGILIINGFPAPSNNTPNSTFIGATALSGVTFPSGATSIYIALAPNSSSASLGAYGSGVAYTNIIASNFVSGSAVAVHATLTYSI